MWLWLMAAALAGGESDALDRASCPASDPTCRPMESLREDTAVAGHQVVEVNRPVLVPSREVAGAYLVQREVEGPTGRWWVRLHRHARREERRRRGV